MLKSLTGKMLKNSQVPVLITWDVDPDLWMGLENRQRCINRVIDLCEELDIRSTFFITAQVVHQYPDELRRMQALGQEVGCHGLTHTSEEEYNRMPEAMQRAYIEEATRKLEAVVGRPIRAFRSPRVKISVTTLRLLAERGYLADSSVCSQRLDVISSNLINKGWILAPRRPYHPHHTNPFKRGDLPIWEIPLSALVVPFTSKVLGALGLPAMKLFFRLLYTESRRTGKPIVYLSHPAEFPARLTEKGKGQSTFRFFNPYGLRFFHPKFFSPRVIRTHGLLIRRLLIRMDGGTLFNSSRELFTYMASFPGVRFMTVSEYTIRNLQGAS